MHNSQISNSDAKTPLSATIPRVATFFALYADPLGLTDGTTYCLVEDSPVRGFPSKVALHLKEDGSPIYLDPNRVRLFQGDAVLRVSLLSLQGCPV